MLRFLSCVFFFIYEKWKKKEPPSSGLLALCFIFLNICINRKNVVVVYILFV